MKRSVLLLEPTATPGGRARVVPPDGGVFVGRSHTCQIRLPETARNVSRVHAQILVVDGAWHLRDQSTKGTGLNSVQVPRGELRPLADGDLLDFAGEEFRVWEMPDAGDHVPETVTVAVEPVDLASVDTLRMLESALHLPTVFEAATSEREILDNACEYLCSTLAPAITSSYVVATGDEDRPVDVLARHDVGSRPAEVEAPMISTRVLSRLNDEPDSVVLLTRRHAADSMDATVALSINCVAACRIEEASDGRTVVLYTVGEGAFATGDKLVTAYMHLVATVARQQLMSNRRQGLTKYFSPRVVELLMGGEGRRLIEGVPRRVTATSLFFDIAGTSARLEKTENIMAFHDDIRAIIDLVTTLVFENDGTIIDYAGDGVFAAWGVPLEQEDQALLAVQCAREIFVRLRTLPLEEFGRPGMMDAELAAVGVAQGEVLAGALGSRSIFKYGILGPTVNLAHRLEALADPRRLEVPIVVSARVHEALRESEIDIVDLGTVEIPGMEPVEAYGVKPPLGERLI